MKKRFASVIALSALGLTMIPTPALASVDFASHPVYTVGGVNYKLDYNGGFGNTTIPGIVRISTPTQSNYALDFLGSYWDGGVLSSYNEYLYCDGDTATQSTESNGDVVVTCAATQLEPTDIWWTIETRFYNDSPLVRQLITFENRGSGSADLDPAGKGNDVYFGDVNGKFASSESPTSCSSLTANDHWVVFSGASNTVINGLAWQATGGTAWTAEGESCDSFVFLYPTLSSIAPNDKATWALFMATTEPSGATTGDMDTAFVAAVDGMSQLDSLNDTLCRGLDGVDLEGWGTCPSSSAPELANTGSTASLVAPGLIAGSSVIVGFIIVMTRRKIVRA